MIFLVLYSVCSLKKVTLWGGDHQNALKSAIQKTTSSTMMTNHIRFNDCLWRKKRIASPFKVLPLTPSPALIRLCVSLCLLQSLCTVDPHSSVCIYSFFFLVLFFCSPSALSRTFLPPPAFTFFSFSHSPTHRGYWGIGRQPEGRICWRWLALLACQWGVKRLPRRCNSSLRADPRACFCVSSRTHKHTHTHTHTHTVWYNVL